TRGAAGAGLTSVATAAAGGLGIVIPTATNDRKAGAKRHKSQKRVDLLHFCSSEQPWFFKVRRVWFRLKHAPCQLGSWTESPLMVSASAGERRLGATLHRSPVTPGLDPHFSKNSAL